MTVELPEELRKRRIFSSQRLQAVRDRLGQDKAQDILSNSGVVYATGSMARGDASENSDLDVFILSKNVGDGRALTKLDSIRLKAKLIDAISAENLPKFSEDGKYLVVHTIDDMLDKLGTAEDDYENLFTARMLLLLESTPILGGNEYAKALSKVIDKYWADFDGNEMEFLPIFLTNDIIRYWKVLCLNYEAFNSNQPDSKRRHQNYKLKFSRLLTCYSAIVHLLALVRLNRGVTPQEAVDTARLKPLDRLIETSSLFNDEAIHNTITKLLTMYEQFLTKTDAPKDTVRKRFESNAYNLERRDEAKQFGDEMFVLLNLVGGKTDLYRYLVV